MAVIWLDGFGGRSAADLALDYEISGTVSPVTMTSRRPDCYGVSMASATMTTPELPSGTRVALTCGFAISLSATGNAGDLFQVLSGSSGTSPGYTVELTLGIDSSGYLKIYSGDSGGSLLLTSSVALSAGIDYYINVKCTLDASVGFAQYTIQLGDTSETIDVGTFQGDVGVAYDYTAARLCSTSDGGTYADFYLIDPYVAVGYGSQPTSLSNPRVDTLWAYREGAYSDFGSADYIDDGTEHDGDSTTVDSLLIPGRSSSYYFDNASRLEGKSIFAQRAIWTFKITGASATVKPVYVTNDGVKAYPPVLWTPSTSYASFNVVHSAGLRYGAYEYAATRAELDSTQFGFEIASSTDRSESLVVTQGLLYVLSSSDLPYDATTGPSAVNSVAQARVTHLTVQTLSDADSFGESRVTHLTVQTLTGGSEITYPADDPWAAATVSADVRIGSPMQLVAEITLTQDSAGLTQTYLLTDGPSFTTADTDTPASTTVYDRLVRSATMDRSMFDGRTTLGAVAANYGVCEINNRDAIFDDWADYNAAGNEFVLRAGYPGAAYPAEWTTVIRATMQTLEADMDSIQIRLRDKLELMDRALLRDTTYADPFIVGRVFNVACKLIDPVNLIYAVGRPPSGKLVVVDAVRDEGSIIRHVSGGLGSSSSTVATEAALTATYVSQGYFNWNPDSGRIRLGSKPYGVLTASAYVIDDTASWSAEDGPGNNAKIGTMLVQLAQRSDVQLSDIETGDANDVDVACGATPFGFWTDSDDRVLTAMNALANSLGVWFGFDRLGRFRMGQLGTPEGASAWSFTQHNVLENGFRRVASQDPGRGVPVWRVVARTNHNNQAQSSFAATTKESDKALMREEWPVEIATEDVGVLDFCPAATEMVFETYSAPAYSSATQSFASTDDAGEADRRLALYSGLTEMVEVQAFASPLLLTTVDIGSVVQVKYPRYGWDDGVQFVVVGVRTQ